MGDQRYIWFRGFRMTWQFRDAWLAAEHRAGFTFRMTQGGFNAGGVAASAGTHDGDAGDWSIFEDHGRMMTRAKIATMIEALRWAGIAASLRTNGQLYGVRAQGFKVPHVHGIPNGWGLPSAGAIKQAIKYRQGRDGLNYNGIDKGPGHTSLYRQRRAPQPAPPKPKPVVPKPTPPPTPPTKEEGLTMADIAKLLAEIGALRNEVRYTSAQLKAIAEGTYSRTAINASTNRQAQLFRNISSEQSKIVTKAIQDSEGKVTVEVLDRIQNSVSAGMTQAIEEAKKVEESALAEELAQLLADGAEVSA